jgi:hypothetical protein
MQLFLSDIGFGPLCGVVKTEVRKATVFSREEVLPVSMLS